MEVPVERQCDLEMFATGKTGTLVPIADTDPELGPWEHAAFLPGSLPEESPGAVRCDPTGSSRTPVRLSLPSTARCSNCRILLYRYGQLCASRRTRPPPSEGPYEPLEKC